MHGFICGELKARLMRVFIAVSISWRLMGDASSEVIGEGYGNVD